MNVQRNTQHASTEAKTSINPALNLMQAELESLREYIKSRVDLSVQDKGYCSEINTLIGSLMEFIRKSQPKNKTTSFWLLTKRMVKMINDNLVKLGEGFHDRQIQLLFTGNPEMTLVGVEVNYNRKFQEAANDELYNRFGDEGFIKAHAKVVKDSYQHDKDRRSIFLEGVNDAVTQIIDTKQSLQQIKGVNIGELKRIEQKLTSKSEDIIMMQKLRKDISVLGAANDAKFEMEEVRNTKLNIKDNESKVKDGFLSGIWSKTKSWLSR